MRPGHNSLTEWADFKGMFQKSFDILGDFKEPKHLLRDMTSGTVIHPNHKHAIQYKLATKHELSKIKAMGVIKRITTD